MNLQQMQELLAHSLSDKYEILSRLGGGGMAEVFLARHRIHGALFAIKVLNSALAEDERIVARFIQEARTAATLSGHPNIVSVFDIGTMNGLYYLIMQYVDGEDLARYLKRQGKLPYQEVVRIVTQVAEALVWASSKGVVHRDLKPSNLYLDRTGRIIVLDFGIAKAADVPSNLTLAYERLGTTYYMSPEQIKGESCDHRSDLYSLGVIFYELLAGCKPFDGDSARAVELAHIHTDPVDLRQIDPDVPLELSRIVRNLLAKETHQRYQSAQVLLKDLQRYTAGLSPIPTPAPELERTQLSSSTVNGNDPRQDELLSVSSVKDVSTDPQPEKTVLHKILILGIVLAALTIAVASIYLFMTKPWIHEKSGVSQEAALPPTRVDQLGNQMVLVPAGDFIFGSDTDHQSPNGREVVRLAAFYVDRTEVSHRDYARFCAATGRTPPGDSSGKLDLPVTNVSFEDAQAYANWIGKRLPTEKEWEKAARGEKGRIYPWGDSEWTRGADGPPSGLQPVLSFPGRVSPYGAYNMAGNVFEWTVSHFPAGDQEFQDMQKTLGTANFSHDWKAIKGGCFGDNPKLDIFWKTYLRRGWPQNVGSPLIGFRCVVDAK